MEKIKRHKCHPKNNQCSMFHPNRTMGKCSQSWERFGGKKGVGQGQVGIQLEGGGNLKKMKTSPMPSQNESK